ILVAAQARAQEGFGARERKAIDEALHAINLTASDLGYEKGPLPRDRSRLPIVDELLRDPLSIPAAADAIVGPIRRSKKPSEILRVLFERLPGGAALSTDGLELVPIELPADRVGGLPEGFAATMARLAGAYRASRMEREKA